MSLKRAAYQSEASSIVLTWPPFSKPDLVRDCAHHVGSRKYAPSGSLAPRKWPR
jgi:hypothetical protein